MKKVCVLTTTYNRSNFILDCVNSVSLQKTDGEFEIEHLIVDDGSTDDTKSILEKSDKIKTVFLEMNQGMTKALNSGLKKIDSDYIYVLDSDDLITQNGIKYLFDFAEHLELNWVYGDAISVSDNLEYLLGKDYYGWQFRDREDMLKSIFTKKHSVLSTNLYKTEILKQVDGYNENLKYGGEHTDLAIRLMLQNYLPKYIRSTILVRRIHKTNMSINLINKPSERGNDLRFAMENYGKQIEKILSKADFEEVNLSLYGNK